MNKVVNWADPEHVVPARPRGQSMRLRENPKAEAQRIDLELWANHLFFIGSIAWLVSHARRLCALSLIACP